MECQRCHTKDSRHFASDQGNVYCRRCVSFSRLHVGQKPRVHEMKRQPGWIEPRLAFELTPFQKKASHQVVESIQNQRSVFVYAATGAGKTEIVLEAIALMLSKGYTVGFAISRRTVVLEIAQRLRQAFPTIKVVEVAQGYTQDTEGDLIVCTTHQLYRYHQSFDLLVLDELDAFPYANNSLLMSLSTQACKGPTIYLSATPDEESFRMIKQGKWDLVELFVRPHGHPLIVPKVWVMPVWLQILYAFWFVRHYQPSLVYVPRIKDALRLAAMFKPWVKVAPFYAGIENQDEVLEQFRKGELRALICTTVLERGITIGQVQVLVCMAEHPVFTSASLVQIFGRVGRSMSAYTGKGVCLCRYRSLDIQSCLKQINYMNRSVPSV